MTPDEFFAGLLGGSGVALFVVMCIYRVFWESQSRGRTRVVVKFGMDFSEAFERICRFEKQLNEIARIGIRAPTAEEVKAAMRRRCRR